MYKLPKPLSILRRLRTVHFFATSRSDSGYLLPAIAATPSTDCRAARDHVLAQALARQGIFFMSCQKDRKNLTKRTRCSPGSMEHVQHLLPGSFVERPLHKSIIPLKSLAFRVYMLGSTRQPM